MFATAHAQGLSHIDILSGDLHRRFGGYPGQDHRMPVCCDVMRKNMRPADEIPAPATQRKGSHAGDQIRAASIGQISSTERTRMKRKYAFERHQGDVQLQHTFDAVEAWVRARGEVALTTRAGSPFTAKAAVARKQGHGGELVILFFGRERSLRPPMSAAGDTTTTATAQG
jgi:hypothetical protein